MCLYCIDQFWFCFMFRFKILYCKFTHILIVQWVVKRIKRIQIKKKRNALEDFVQNSSRKNTSVRKLRF